ncbi:PREDICTED: lamin-like protein [Lupinus angustifolius]|uniref:lamin-like protein n=1 Tax=Lupinus angustifolius TaxID=3871 RepID=UPI00092E3CBC|nr:PREDICTED: lamin-like protein [Lupinus angustifolius]
MDLKRKLTLCLLITITMCFHITQSRDTSLHRVGGGRYTWVPNVNFTDWANHEHFYKGDWLYFGFDKHIYNVLEVNKTSYENCIEEGFINNITRGGRDVFQLLEARLYYFLSGRGFCFQGMKVAINVEESAQAPQLVLAAPNEAFASSRMNHTIGLVLLAAALAWTLILQKH